MITWHAVLKFDGLLLLAAFTALSYGFTVRRLAELVQPYRLRLAERGEKYLKYVSNDTECAIVQFYLDNAFNPWFMVASALLLPIAAVMQIIKPHIPEFPTADPGIHNELSCLFFFSSLATNPLFTIIVAIEILILAIPSILLAGNLSLIKRAVSAFMQREIRGRATNTA
jgi:hypothetical protein